MAEAVLVVDMIHDFVDGRYGSEGAREIVPAVKRVLDAARDAGVPVVYVRDAHTPGDPDLEVWGEHAMEGTWGSEFVPELEPEEGDVVLPKHTYSGFYGTGLEDTLRGMGVDRVVLAGVSTDICVQNTAGDAFWRGFRLAVLRDGTAAIEPSVHERALEYMASIYNARIVDTADVTERW